MSLLDRKITDTDVSTKGVIAAPDTMTGTAAENKAVFDRLLREPVKTKLNGLIDDLVGDTAASQLGFDATEGIPEDNIQGAIERLYDDETTGVAEAKAAAAEAKEYAAAVHYPVSYGENQSLTEEQKIQARHNIGANGWLVELVWQNVTPDAPFADNTESPLQISLSSYRFCYVEYRLKNNLGTLAAALICKNAWYNPSCSDPSSGTVVSRASYFTSSSFAFGDGKKIAGIGTIETDNNRMVPFRIYGVR